MERPDKLSWDMKRRLRPEVNSTEAVVNAVSEPYVLEIQSLLDVLGSHVSAFTKAGRSVENSSSFEDCVLLYSLVRYFDVKGAFEVGTYVGTTAVAIASAVKKNDGVFTTCDPADFGVLPADLGIRFFHGPSCQALEDVKERKERVDFAFFDWVPDERTLDLASECFVPEAILAVHDYGSDPKGEQVVRAINSRYAHAKKGKWFYPNRESAPVVTASGLRVNMCTAFFLPFVYFCEQEDPMGASKGLTLETLSWTGRLFRMLRSK